MKIPAVGSSDMVGIKNIELFPQGITLIESKPVAGTRKFVGAILELPYFPWPIHQLIVFTNPTTHVKFAGGENEELMEARGLCELHEGAIIITVNLDSINASIDSKSPVRKHRIDAEIMNTIAHECLHATFKVLMRADADEINIDDNNEHMTYLIGAFSEMTLNILAILKANKWTKAEVKVLAEPKDKDATI